MWIPPSNKKMTDAAKTTGFHSITLVYEPQCAAALVAMDIQNSRGKSSFKIDDAFLVCDPGGGTGDFVTYQVKEGITDGARVSPSS